MGRDVNTIPKVGDKIVDVQVDWSDCRVAVSPGTKPWQSGYAELKFESGNQVSIYLTRDVSDEPSPYEEQMTYNNATKQYEHPLAKGAS